MTTPTPFVHSNANHRRAMRAMVDKLIESNFKYWQDRDDRRHISVEGGYYVEGINVFENDNVVGDYVKFDHYRSEFHCINYYNFDHIVIIAKIRQEIVDVYRDSVDVFDDPTGTGYFDYSPIELIDDPEGRYSWAMRILADNLIKANFDPTVFRTYRYFPFSLVVEPDEFTFNIRATVRKDKYRLLSNDDGKSR